MSISEGPNYKVPKMICSPVKNMNLLEKIYRIHEFMSWCALLTNFQIPEIVTFMLLLIVFILAYGVAIQAIIDPYREFSLETIGKVLFSILFMPYWQMYGELSLEDIAVQDSSGCWNTEAFNVSSTSSNTTVSSLDTMYLLTYYS